MTAYLVVSLIAAVLIWLVLLNVAYWRERCRMTPEERKQQDKEIRDDLFIW